MALDMDGKKDSAFHDFLGMSYGESPSGGVWGRGRDGGAVDRPREAEASVSSGGRGVPPAGSDVNSARKRSYSDSSFMGLPKERMLPVVPDSREWPRMVKAYGKEVVEERPRRPHEDEMALAVSNPSKQNPVSLHPIVSGRPDPVFSKWERSMNMNAAHIGHHHLSRFSQGGAFVDKSSSACKDPTSGTVLVSPAAADEGSRTGMKGSGVLKILNAGGMPAEKIATGVLTSNPRPRNIPQITEPESSNMPSRHGGASLGRQMTIFYAGQAHVFDDVHPNKADVIMTLAGSSGGSWSTNYSKTGNHLPIEDKVLSRENQAAYTTPPFSQDHGSRFQIQNLSPVSQPPVVSHIPMSLSGAHQGGGNGFKAAGSTSVQETNAEHKRNV